MLSTFTTLLSAAFVRPPHRIHHLTASLSDNLLIVNNGHDGSIHRYLLSSRRSPCGAAVYIQYLFSDPGAYNIGGDDREFNFSIICRIKRGNFG